MKRRRLCSKAATARRKERSRLRGAVNTRSTLLSGGQTGGGGAAQGKTLLGE
jgi:hypothetical protein